MNHLDILLPFCVPPPELSRDLLKSLNGLALATLIARTSGMRHEELEPFSRALPHEAWLSRQFGITGGIPDNGSPAVASAMMARCGVAREAGIWFVIQPVHLHIARDHLVLTDRRRLVLPDKESRALFDAVKPLFEEIDRPLLYGDADHWFMRADDWNSLRTATPDAAAGHNIDIWLPQGAGERAWRKLQNEIQMHWHDHPVNEAREMRGSPTINSIWLWGAAAANVTPSTVYGHAFNLSGWASALAAAASNSSTINSADEVFAASPKPGLLMLDQLVEPALSDDWSDWILRFQDLELRWFAPILEAIRKGKINRVTIIATGTTTLSEITVTRNSLRKFWVKPSLSRLAQ